MIRSISIDCLRGAAIILMVLSGVIPFGGALPAWMYHAQVPPPEHVFKPEVAGITWVDLVFPFFLFSMGAAVPFALPKRLEQSGVWDTLKHVFQRFLLLLIFAVISFNLAPLRIPGAGIWANTIGIAGFAGLFLAFVRYPGLSAARKRYFQVSGWAILAGLAVWLSIGFHSFKPAVNDPIIRVLANVYLVGSVIWLLTRNQPLLRVGIALVFLAMFLGDIAVGSWVNKLWRWHDPWNFVSLYLLKYLLIFIPGTLIGDWIAGGAGDSGKKGNWLLPITALLSTVLALWSLLSRHTPAGFAGTAILLIATYWLVIGKRLNLSNVEKIFLTGSLLLLSGYLVEPFQDGIKKDPSTLSYFLVTSGLASLWVCAFEEMGRGALRQVWNPVALTGQNALMAYLMAGFLIVPILSLTGVAGLFAGSTTLGVLKGALITALVTWISAGFAGKKVFWKL